MSSIKDKIESHQSLFEGKMSLYEDLMLLAESDCEQSSIDNVVSDYLVVLSDLRNRKNLASLSPSTHDSEESITLTQLDIECSRANRYQQELSIVNVTIDGIESANLPEDEVINTIEDAIKSMIRKPDYVGRIESSELLILLPSTPSNFSEVVINKIEAHLLEMKSTYHWKIDINYCLTNYIHWEEYDLTIKRLKHGIIKGKRDQSAIVHI